MKRVLVGMSGGIDSSVAAYLLKQQGYEVMGVTMSLWKEGRAFSGDYTKDACFSPNKEAEIAKTAEICAKLGISHTVLDISDLYESTVLKNFRDEYMGGRTPNPCIWCNQKIKFGAMVEYARKAGLEFDFFATGHYARIEYENGRYCLKRGLDPLKDQSYFLYRLSQRQLSTTLFPLGGMTKKDVRAIDETLGFHPQGQAESQDFYSGSYSDLLDTDPVPGDIVDTEGKVLGRHNGIWNYTIGQRKGLGVSAPKPLYVISLDVKNNRVVVGTEEMTVNTVVRAANINWVSVGELPSPIHAAAKIRSTGTPVACEVYMDGQDRLCAKFDVPVKAATCGQSLVVYKDDAVLAGGIIESVD
jgi:tRNA-specific 2-thiouridylase